MSLDIHVMPLWKFWAGEYTTAAERFAETQGLPVQRLGSAKARFSKTEAQELVNGLQVWIKRQTGIGASWNDEGETAFSEQFQFDGIHAVRAFAAQSESSDQPFSLEAGFADDPALLNVLAGGPTTFPHLMRHEDNSGFYVPLDFADPTDLAGAPPAVGSSIRLMMELAKIRQRLGLFPTYDELCAGADLGEPHPGLAWVKYGVAYLYHVCWISVQTQLPIIIDG